MQVIITHEQADFDAVASLLAAYLLNKDAIPVLPFKINRNVRAFLTLYGSDLPFVEYKDLPARGIDSVMLVDTQAMQSIRGLTSDVHVFCLDHHPQRKDLPPSWTASIQSVGATATILVEKIQELGGDLHPIHASLLLLGIYEDTGSLTFSRTNPRDLLAAAYLLSSGADLARIDEFLRHPLSPEQQNLYLELVRTVETYEIQGERILIASGILVQDGMELSTLAHRLRDWFEPSALFMLIQTRGGVQVIARSNSDQVDVAVIAKAFSGGGHTRASAALVHEQSLSQVKETLLSLLNSLVQPGTTVAQLMSLGLQFLPPKTPASSARELMQRYGFEGYPVVQEGRVVGLLTRRAVDRALSHQLDLPASSLMDAGNYVVHPEDSVDTLRQIMINSGWGQLPVADSKSGRLIGIVTRTDLLQSPGMGSRFAKEKRNYAQQMQSLLPADRLALIKAVARAAVENHLRIYIVGGFVRDLILKHPSPDFDIVVEGDAIQLGRGLLRLYGGRLKTHERFGTAKWYLPHDLAGLNGKLIGGMLQSENLPRTEEQSRLPVFLDLVTARTEFYTTPSALPIVEPASIKLDLHRRDFTINTLALRLDGQHFGDLFDFWGGVSDLEHGIIRVLHSLSFVDDPTRILRAVRFEQRFGFQIEERTLQLILAASDLLQKLSGDRIRHELEHILSEQAVTQMFERLNNLGVLSAIHPALYCDAETYLLFRKVSFVPQLDIFGLNLKETGYSWTKLRQFLLFGLWLTKLSEDQIRAVAVRIHHPQQEVTLIIGAKQIIMEIPKLIGALPSAVVEYFERFSNLSILIAGYAINQSHELEILQLYLTRLRFVSPHFDGNDIRKRGIPPGPIYRVILNTIRSKLLDGEIQTLEQEEQLLDKLIAFSNKVEGDQSL